MTVTLKPGNAYINGYRYKNDSDLTLTIDTADGVLKRIDRIVIRSTTLDREIKAYVKKGNFASSPVAPELQRDADMWELGVADVYVANGAVSISQANITDLRLNSTYCGIVSGVVDQVDTTTLFNQYQTWYQEITGQAETNLSALLGQFQTDFNAWFVNLQDTLDENTAGNLLSMINDNAADIEVHTTAISNNTAGITALEERLDNSEEQNTVMLTFAAWSELPPYTQTIEVIGIDDDCLPDKIIPQYSDVLSTAIIQNEAYNMVSYFNTGINQITFTCLTEKPKVDIPLLIIGGVA
jgi:hypothetical protein